MSQHSFQYTGGSVAAGPADRIADVIRAFIARSRRPVLVEPGCDPIPLSPECHNIECRSDTVMLEAWSEQRNLSRRITGIESQDRARLALVVERFGKKSGILILIDEEAPRGAETGRRLSRLTFRERFRCALKRRFCGWRIAELTMEADLAHTLSPNFPRALVRKGLSGWAAIGAGHDAETVLTHGLIWLDYLRVRERRLTIEGLLLYVPAGRERTTCLRLRWMDPRAARYEVLAFTPDGYEDVVDLRDHGNLETRVEPCREGPSLSAEVDSYVHRLRAVRGVESIARADGSLSLRVRGLEFARVSENKLLWGLETKRPARTSNLGEIVQMAEHLNRLRTEDCADRAHPLYQRNPEAWLESQVRANLRELDSRLRPAPVYGQVPQFTAGERDVIDLLGVEGDGRLSVIELKANEDVHLPMQALDYWIRVRWHAERGDFGANGYFRGTALRRDPPRLLLAGPALEFHPTNEKVLRYFAPEIDVERVGVGLEWRDHLKVMFRYRS
jgi:hypothetical protein